MAKLVDCSVRLETYGAVLTAILLVQVFSGPAKANEVIIAQPGSLLASASETDATAGTAPPPGKTTVNAPASSDDVLNKPCVADSIVYRQMADEFVTDPKAFVDKFWTHQASVAVPVRNVLASRPKTIDLFIKEIERVGFDSEGARQIALGIGQATLMCSGSQPQVSLKFQERMAAIDNENLRLAFISATGELGTTALSSGGRAVSAPSRGPSAPSISNSPSIGTFGSADGEDGVVQTAESYSFRGSTSSVIFRTRSTNTIVSRTTP